MLLLLLRLLLLRGWRLRGHGLVEGRLRRVLDAVQPGGLRGGYPREGRRVEVRVQSADGVAHWKRQANTATVSAKKNVRQKRNRLTGKNAWGVLSKGGATLLYSRRLKANCPLVTWETARAEAVGAVGAEAVRPALPAGGRGQRAAGQAPVRVPARANVTPPAAAGGGAFQDRLMHRQDWVGRETNALLSKTICH